MITLKILEYNDKIHADDLVRNVYPASYYCAYSDDNGESTLCWHYAKFQMPGWIGKTLKQYREFDKDKRNYPVSELMIVRVPKNLTREHLNALGMPIHMPSASMRKLHYDMIDRGKFGNMEHYPKKVKLTFGKYKGRTVEEVYNDDQRYLEWLNDNVKLKGEIKDSVADWLRSDA